MTETAGGESFEQVAEVALATGASEPTDDELRAQCTRFLMGRGRSTPEELLGELATLGDELSIDVYGAGGAVAALEARVQELLGKPAVVFMPSGTMAQQIALRIHADRAGRRVVAFHPTCHLELHEDKAYQRLHALVGRPVGNARELMTAEDLAAINEPLAAVVFELPQREIGGMLPSWQDLRAQVAAVRETGAAVHLDGARLWECTPHYARDLHEIAALFDSVYVSFYKGLGGLAGCCLAGDEQPRRGGARVARAARRQVVCDVALRRGRAGRSALTGFRECRATSSTRGPSRQQLAGSTASRSGPTRRRHR